MLAVLHPVSDHSNRMENYLPYVQMYDFSMLNYPVSHSSFAPFAAKNHISINVSGVEDGKRVILTLRVSDVVVPDRYVDLLLHEMGEIQHYSTIKDFSRLISGQLSNHEHAVYCCKNCLHAYSTPELLADHSKDCCHVQHTKFPKDPRFRVTNIQKQLVAPIVVYADFESVLEPLSDVDTTQGVAAAGTEPSVTPYQEHVTCSFAYKIVSSVDPDFSPPLVMYRGKDAADKFVRDLQKEAKQLCDEYIAKPKPMIFSTEDSLGYANAAECHICTKPLADDDQVRDHCHITGVYRGAAHNACNLNYRLNPKSCKLPIVMHNLKGYDGHLIVKSLKSEFGNARVIPQNLEKYLSLSVGQLKFLDSFQFTPKSLDVLAKILEDDEFRYLVESCTASHFDLIRRKGVYPYDYMDSVKRFDKTELPSQNDFFSNLSGDSCSDADYAHAIRIWDAFECETMGDYHDIILQLDVLLLADFFRKIPQNVSGILQA